MQCEVAEWHCLLVARSVTERLKVIVVVVVVVGPVQAVGRNAPQRGGQREAVAPGRSRQGGAKQPDQKYFMTKDHKSEFDIVF